MRSPRPRGNRRSPALFPVLLPALPGLLLAVALLTPAPIRAEGGNANGKVAVYDTADSAYGFSAYTGGWTSRALDAPAAVRRCGKYLGLLRTHRQIYAFNCVNERWFNRGFIGLPSGEDAEGAVAVVWTTRAIYGIATPWTLWRDLSLPAGAVPIGGGSAGDFGLVWTTTMIYGYHAATHQWMPQPVTLPPIGGIAEDGLGLVWTDREAYAFDPTPGGWVALTLQDPRGVSAAGSGDVAVVWSNREAQAYSGPLDAWYPLTAAQDLVGGAACGEVALVWDELAVHAFDANTGGWSSRTIREPLPSGLPDSGLPGFGAPAGLSAAPNPSPGGRLALTLPFDGNWRVQVFSPSGSLVRTADAVGSSLLWDGRDEDDRAVAAGSYWIRAEADGRVEALRVVVAP